MEPAKKQVSSSGDKEPISSKTTSLEAHEELDHVQSSLSSDRAPTDNSRTGDPRATSPKPEPASPAKLFQHLKFLLLPHTNFKLLQLKQQAYQDAGALVSIFPKGKATNSKTNKNSKDIKGKGRADVVKAEDATHYIVVRKNWDFDNVEKYVGKDVRIPTTVKVVTDEWAAESIERGRVVDTGSFELKREEPEIGQVEQKEATMAQRVKREHEQRERSMNQKELPVEEIQKLTANQEAKPEIPGKGDDILTPYLRKAGLQGLIESYLSSDDEGDDSGKKEPKPEHSAHTIKRAPSPDTVQLKTWSPYSVLLSKPSDVSLEHNPNWRTIEIVCFAVQEELDANNGSLN